MAIHTTPLLAPERPAAPASGIDVYLAECHNVWTGPAGAVEPAFCGVTVLVGLACSAADRLAFEPLRHALSSAQVTVLDGLQPLADRVAVVKPQFAAAVVFVGADDGVVAETIQSAIDALRRQFGTALAAVVVVSASMDRLTHLTGVSGFVRDVHATDGRTARQVFLALCAFIAPETLNGIDVLDLLPVLGPVSAPTVWAEAIWLRESAGRLIHASNADRDAVARADQIVAVPFAQGWTWDGLDRFHQALRKTARSNAPIVFAADNHWRFASVVPRGLVSVGIFCASHG